MSRTTWATSVRSRIAVQIAATTLTKQINQTMFQAMGRCA